MSALGILFLGLALGLRHALDADHVVVLSTLLAREPSATRATRLAILWGLGHSAAFLAIGLGIVLLDLELPAGFDIAAQFAVGVMLIGLGAFHLRRVTEAPSPALALSRPVAAGILHGLAGSASIALLTSATIGSRAVATLYLLLFASGTVLGMLTLTVALSQPLAWVLRTERGPRWIRGVSALLSLVLGLTILHDLQSS